MNQCLILSKDSYHAHTTLPHHSISPLQTLLEWDLELNNEAAQEHTILSVTQAHSDSADEIAPLTHSACYHKSYWIVALLASLTNAPGGDGVNSST